MQGLITDRTQYNISRRNALSAKGWSAMTTEERKEWLGNPLDATGVNLFSCGPYHSSVVDLKYRSEEIVATATSSGIYLYAISIIGEASNYENKVFTLSAESMISSSGGTPKLEVFWHDEHGYDYAGGSLLVAGSVTFNTTEWKNTNARKYLAVYVYVTADVAVSQGDYAVFKHVMLENGSVRNPYKPYTEVLPTPTTKGAYNYSDLNRVERAVAEISDLAGLNLVTKIDWGMWDIPTESEMNRYIGNIATIRQRLTSGAGIPMIPASMNNLTYSDANNIEKILNAGYETAKVHGGA